MIRALLSWLDRRIDDRVAGGLRVRGSLAEFRSRQPRTPRPDGWIENSPQARSRLANGRTARFRVSSPIGRGVRLLAEFESGNSVDFQLGATQARELGQQLIAFAGNGDQR